MSYRDFGKGSRELSCFNAPFLFVWEGGVQTSCSARAAGQQLTISLHRDSRTLNKVSRAVTQSSTPFSP